MAGKLLTHRQRAFLRRFLDLYREAREPLHYTEVARRLGVGPVTAYEMLRLLEERGLAQAEYRRPAGRRGPGRAAVFFRPTAAAEGVLRQLSGGELTTEDWTQVEERILARLEAALPEEYEALLEELLARVPEEPAPLVYLAEVTAGILLALEEVLRGAQEDPELVERLRTLGIPEELGLRALAGLSTGLALTGRLNRRIASRLLVHARRYRQALARLARGDEERLSRFVREVSRRLAGKA